MRGKPRPVFPTRPFPFFLALVTYILLALLCPSEVRAKCPRLAPWGEAAPQDELTGLETRDEEESGARDEEEAVRREGAEAPDLGRDRPLGERWSEGWTHFKEDGIYLLTFYKRPTRRGILYSSLVGAGIVTLVFLDDEIRVEVQEARTESLDEWEDRIEPLGAIRNTTLGALAVYGTGKLFRHQRTAETGRALLEALVFTEAVDVAAKGFFGRREPDDDVRANEFFRGESFFPSGHTARAFAFATVLAERHGPVAAWIGYPVATLVGLSRIERDVHWASDILAGAALGHVISRSIVQRRAGRAPMARRFWVEPNLMPSEGGLELKLRLRWN